MNIGGYGNPETTPGGEYWRRACSLRIRVKKGKCFDENGKELSQTETGAVGHTIEVALLKSKFCRWDRKLGVCHLNYTKGFDLLQDTIDVASFFGIVEKAGGSWVRLIDPDTGEALSDKVNGNNQLKKFLESNPEIWRKVYDMVYSKLSVKDVPNAVSYENMLGIDVNALFGIDLNKESE